MGEWLTNEQGKVLLALARAALRQRLMGGELPPKPDVPAFLRQAAVFVTLKIAGNLRGCIGNLKPVGPLWEAVLNNTVNAAFHDQRFPPLLAAELERVHLDISVLSFPQTLEYEIPADLPTKLRPGIDGVILGDGRRSATFLPQVWRQLPTPEQFLGQLCLKAGLGQRAWQEKLLDVQIYQVQSLSEETI
jgi:AmmeMemoRadiSam system protein A